MLTDERTDGSRNWKTYSEEPVATRQKAARKRLGYRKMSYRVERQTNGQMDKWTNRKQIKSPPFYRTLFSHWAAAQKGTNKRGKEWKPVVQGDNALYNAWYIWPFIKPL